MMISKRDGWTCASLLLSMSGPLICDCRAQAVDPASYVLQWGLYAFDTRSREGRIIKAVCGWNNTAHLRHDGRLFLQGPSAGLGAGYLSLTEVPPLPQGLSYVDVALNRDYAMAVRSDGSAIGWGGVIVTGIPVAPPLPPGLSYLRVAVSTNHGLLLRSDGAVVAFGSNALGQCNVPPLPPGVAVVDIQVSYGRSAIHLADGTVLLFGSNQWGQSAAPTLPAGVTYTAMAAKRNDYTLLLRSDGVIEAFGSNTYGQCNVPPLPAGFRYKFVGAGDGFGAAVRSDNTFVVWGASSSSFGIGSPPPIPSGLRCVGMDVGQGHVVALLSDGRVLSWGHNTFYDHYTPYRSQPGVAPLKRHVHGSVGLLHTLLTNSDGTMDAFGDDSAGQLAVPPLPFGVRYVRGGAGSGHSLALRSDGVVVAFGSNAWGALNVPPLPAGMTYTDMSVEGGHSVVLRSDGNALAFGDNSAGQCNIPPLPPGTTYLEAAVHWNYTILLRSDGTLAFCGGGVGPIANLPSAPPGTKFVDIAATKNFAVAIASDSRVVAWGVVGGPYWVPLPPLPAGVYYVEVQGAYWDAIFRRSDGQVVVMGGNVTYGSHVPTLEPGTSYVQVSGLHESLAARASSTCTYVGIAPGCAGSMPPAPLIPRDTPRIGRTLEVNIRNLPIDLAALGMGFQQPALPISLATIGMPGCSLNIQVDSLTLVSGQANTARFLLPIPDQVSLVGLRFYHQAMVLDPAAGNPMGAVLSDAAEGVIGYP